MKTAMLLVRGEIPLVTASSQAARSGKPENQNPSSPSHLDLERSLKSPSHLDFPDLLLLHGESLLKTLGQAGKAGEHLNLRQVFSKSNSNSKKMKKKDGIRPDGAISESQPGGRPPPHDFAPPAK